MTATNFLGRVPDDARCTARSSRTGEPCRNPIAHRAGGSTKCRVHGAGSLASKAKAARAQMQSRYEIEAIRFGERAVRRRSTESPMTLFRDELNRTLGWIRYLEAVIENLDDGQIVWGVNAKELRDAGVRTRDMASLLAHLRGRTHPAVEMLERQSTHYRQLLSIAITHDVHEKARQIDLEKVDGMQRVLDVVLRKFGHDPADVSVRERVKSALRAL